MKRLISLLLAFILAFTQTLACAEGSFWGSLWNSAVEAAQGVTDAATSAWDATSDAATSAWDTTTQAATSAWDATSQAAADAWGIFSQAAANAFNAAGTTASDALSWITQTATDTWDWTSEKATQAWDWAGATLTESWLLTSEQATALMGQLGDWVTLTGEQTLTTLQNAFNKLLEDAGITPERTQEIWAWCMDYAQTHDINPETAAKLVLAIIVRSFVGQLPGSTTLDLTRNLDTYIVDTVTTWLGSYSILSNRDALFALDVLSKAIKLFTKKKN